MNYVEFLRVLRTLRVLGYICAGFIVLALVLLPWSHDEYGSSIPAGVNPIVTVNADGTVTKSYTSKRGAHVSIHIAKDGLETITVTQPAATAGRSGHANIKIGPMSVNTYSKGRSRVSVMTNDPHIPLGTLFLIAGCVAAVFGALFGLAFSRENDGHLELAWTKPASRTAYGLATIATDVAGLIVAFVMTIATIFIVLGIHGGAQYIRPYADSWISLVFALLFALSYYAIMLASTASLRRGATVVLSIFWPVALLLPVFTGVSGIVGKVIRTLDTVNPNAYFYSFAQGGVQLTWLSPTFQIDFVVLAAIAVIAIAASLAQWRRLEA